MTEIDALALLGLTKATVDYLREAPDIRTAHARLQALQLGARRRLRRLRAHPDAAFLAVMNDRVQAMFLEPVGGMELKS